MGSAAPTKRSANWDLLRALAMLFVVVVHSLFLVSGDNSIPGIDPGVVYVIAIMCDSVFFMLSGFFAIRPMKRTLKDYYLNKVSTIILPLILYAIILYFYGSLLSALPINLISFFAFFADELPGNWWFIPALVPCLVVAPFISKGFDHLSDKQVFAIGAVTLALYLWGLGMTFIGWVGDTLDIRTVSSFSDLSLLLLPPGLFVGAPAYFQFFIMGGVFRRMTRYLRGRAGTMLIIAGLIFWILDILFTTNGIPKVDPSYSWMFVTLGIMTLFDRITITAKVPSSLITWVGKRSYSIYLLQFTTLNIVTVLLYERNILGVVSTMGDPARIGMWLLTILSAYLLALAVASICDPLLLSNMQKLFDRLFIHRERGSRHNKGAGETDTLA